MLVKYAVDAAAVWLATRQVWSPLDYLLPSMTLREPKLRLFPAWLLVAMLLWSLPFLWIGACMTVRRALDAGRSPWLVILFFVPIVNYVTMLWLSMLPSRPAAALPRQPTTLGPASLRAAVLALAASIAVGIGLVFVITFVLQEYGVALFLGVPFVTGATSAFLLNREQVTDESATLRLAALTVLLGSVGLLLFMLEGLVCVVTALPLAIPTALLGATVGRVIALRRPGAALHAVVLVLAVPGVAALETAGPPPVVREIVSAIEVQAPPEVVWRHVAAFREIPDTPAWFFRLGIAYPLRAVMDGEGVGALRRCEFSTGAFLEPITAWDAPRRLSFDVAAQPDPMRELTPYSGVHPPHLDGTFRARRGEFRLVALPDGHTRLEGSTWYTLDMTPNVYWGFWADFLVHAIHDRVLAHVKRLAEKDGHSGPPCQSSPQAAQVGEDLGLELGDRLAERAGEGAVAVHDAAIAEVVEHHLQPVALDQVIGHQERELVGLQRAVALMAQRELARRAEGGEVQTAVGEARVLAGAGDRPVAPLGERVEAQALQHLEGDPLGQALRQPLVGAAVAAGEVELYDVGQLVGDQPAPLEPPARRPRVQEHAPGPGQACRERRDLVDAVGCHVALVHQALAERGP